MTNTFSSVVDQHAWLVLGSREKVRSILELTQGIDIRTVLEIGSGTGAILQGLDRAAFAEHYWALEPADDMLKFMQDQVKISRLVEAEGTTLVASRFRGQHFDLAILSHVLEHVDDPAALLSDAIDMAEYVLVEVPTDGNWCGNLRAKVKTSITKVERINNKAGHIHFFSCDDARKLVHWAGGEVIRDRLYDPFSDPAMRLRWLSHIKWAVAGLVGAERWARFWHGHYSMLLCRRPGISEVERSNWTNFYYPSLNND